LEHRFHLSNQTLARWLSQWTKAMSLMAVANAVMFVGLYFILWLTGSWWWLFAAGAAFAVTVLIGYIAPVLILPLFIKYEPLEDESLQQELSQLAEGTGLTIAGTYRLNLSADTKKANAMLAGLGRTRRVLLGDTLLENFSIDEIKVVMAHEIGHHVHRHILKMLLLSIPYSLLTFWIFNLLLKWWIGPAYDPSHMPAYAVAMFMLAAFVFGTLTGPLHAALMRHFERQCDWYALTRTRLADAYRSAFTKLARLNKADPDPHWLEVLLFDDHPPIAERLAMAERFGDKVTR
jgi:STE24 endopeptidase